jgi:hypothetical protein
MTIIRFPIKRSNAIRDRAATLTTAVLEIIKISPAMTVAQELENYLRDELVDVARANCAERELADA